MKYIGKQINIGFGKETTRGTAVAVGSWVPKMDMSFDEKYAVIEDESSIGVITDSKDALLTQRWAEGDISGNVEVGSFGYIMLAMMGSVSSAVATTGAYTHTFTLNNTNQSQSLTIGVKDPGNASDMQFPLAMLQSLTISSEMGGLTTFKTTFKSIKGNTTTHTVTYPTDYKLLSRFSVFKTAANLAGLSGATAACIKSFEIKFTKDLEEDFCLGSLDPRDFLNKKFSVDGSFTAMYENETDYKNTALAGTKRAIRFSLSDTSTTIGVSSNPGMTIDLANAVFTEWSRSQGNGEVVMQTLKFKGLYSVADSSTVNVSITNTKATY